MKKILFLILFFVLSIPVVYAHCPLCTVGAAAVATGAIWFGVSKLVVALFIGAFAISVGWWIARVIKKRYIPHQKPVLIILSFILTVLPVLPILNYIYPIYISLTGDYGSLLNRTYIINLSLVTALIGGFIVSIGPWLSSKISKLNNNKILPFQGIILTFVLLIMAGVAMQFLI